MRTGFSYEGQRDEESRTGATGGQECGLNLDSPQALYVRDIIVGTLDIQAFHSRVMETHRAGPQMVKLQACNKSGGEAKSSEASGICMTLGSLALRWDGTGARKRCPTLSGTM